MQFLANGPDIPESLLTAHEEGRVVFFCGAGISYPAGLPCFGGLVDEIYQRIGTTKNHLEQEAYNSQRYDVTVDLLERRLTGQRMAVRRKVQDILQPKLRRKGAKDTHKALLELARTREGVLRLVTTNFDRIFENIVRRRKQKCEAFVAPLLPIPKNSRWNGIVYLHGLLPEDPNDETFLQRLVLSSGDFGLAYLTERWAARFVSELFRNFIVCFVGYSIGDPILRYMMDALAADRMQGESKREAYAFGGYSPGKGKEKADEWEAKGVTPILYDEADKHGALHSTIKAWAETYRDGVLGKERIVLSYASVRPKASTKQDNYVTRMLWALSDSSGLPAKRFAEHKPAPPLEWLEVFSENCYCNEDLTRFGVIPCVGQDENLKFSLLRRPASHNRAPMMSLVHSGQTTTNWDRIMVHLGHWLTNYLNDPNLILWVSQQGGQLHERFASMIEEKLEKISRLEREGKNEELEQLQNIVPNEIPNALMRTLWRFVLSRRIKSPGHGLGLSYWKDRLRREGLTATLKVELRELLAPKIILRRPLIPTSEGLGQTGSPQRLRDLVDWELGLESDHVHLLSKDLKKSESWRDSFHFLLDDFQQLLLDALDLLHELGEANDHSDRSHWDLPSISPHWQNRDFQDWVVLIELVRDAWLAVLKKNPLRATRIAEEWFEMSYPTFKRLALFAASHDGCIRCDQWVNWLIDDKSWWLWSDETRRETMRLFVQKGKTLSSEAQRKLESAILAGPPRSMYREDIDIEKWQSIVNHSVWLWLAKLQQGGSTLGAEAQARFEELTEAYPGLKLSENESEEFPHWMIGTGDPDFDKNRVIDIAPRKRKDLVAWLKQKKPQPSWELFYEDTWPNVCKKHLANAGAALCDLVLEKTWFTERWADAFHVWAGSNRLAYRSWCCVAPSLQDIPDPKFERLKHALAWWLRKVSETIDIHEDIFFNLCQRVFDSPYEESDESDDPVSLAINHPVGLVTEALLNLWFKREPNDNKGLSPDIKKLFGQLCDTKIKHFRHGRVLLASRVIPLFRVDRSWAEENLLPLFDWSKNLDEARAAWKGFLWSPRLYQPLLIAIKEQFLATARYFERLDRHGQQYASFLTYAALNSLDGFTENDFQEAVNILPQEGVEEIAQTLVRALEAAGEQRAKFWKHRIQPFWHKIWPKSRGFLSDDVAKEIARLVIAAQEEFPTALLTVKDWLKPIKHTGFLVERLHESGLIAQFPEEALFFLARIIDKSSLPSKELGDCLKTITQVAPELQTNPEYKRLAEYAREIGVME